MPSPKSGEVVGPESPDEPDEAEEAMESEGGEVEDTESETGEGEGTDTGSTTVEGKGKGGETGGGGDDEEEETHKVDILLKDSKGDPVANEPFKVKFSDNSKRSGKTDEEGKATLEDVPAGNCEITFTKIHETEVKAK